MKHESIVIDNYAVIIRNHFIGRIEYNDFREGGTFWYRGDSITARNEALEIIFEIDKSKYQLILRAAHNDNLPSFMAMNGIVSQKIISRIDNMISESEDKISELKTKIEILKKKEQI